MSNTDATQVRSRFASLAGLLVQIDLSDNPLKSHGFAQVQGLGLGLNRWD